jgi:hypothetical protein
VKAKTFDRKFDVGDDVSKHLDLAQARRLNQKPRCSGISPKRRTIREEILPLAKAQGLITDEDILRAL